MSAAVLYALIGFALGSVCTLIVFLMLLASQKLEIVCTDDDHAK